MARVRSACTLTGGLAMIEVAVMVSLKGPMKCGPVSLVPLVGRDVTCR